MLAVQLYQRGVPVSIVENALVLAAVRRLIRPADAPPLTTVRSMGLLPAGHRGSARNRGWRRVFQYARRNPEAPLSLMPHAERTPQPRLRRRMTPKSQTSRTCGAG